MTKVSFYDEAGNRWAGLSLDRFHERLRGWIGRPVTPECQALFLAPCQSVHFWGMAAVLDVLFLQRGGAILDHYRGVRPGTRPLMAPGAWGVLEIPSNLIPPAWTPSSILWRPL